ncbi:Protein-export protein SecB (maintains pre-export unfolded state) [hydrothermal vent metagenome]|uniref:Protein-export protein SecB (Maintains pre-export unfolded state) n=1 Tax=hydrothermal vent metagenome TaxID=652676 RepID=A0A3B0WR36_9ZZZZ
MSEDNQQFLIQKIYLKDVSFESPNSPQALTDWDWQPEINVQINSSHQVVGENIYEIVLDITVTAKQDDKTAFLAEIKQAGLFMLSGFSEDNLSGMLGAYCPEALFPYAREAVSEMITKGGFPPLLLSPVNFNALFAQQKQKQQQADQGAAH